MFYHLFTLMWNKKKQHFLLLFEMLFSFFVIFAVFSSIVYYYQNYKKPIGFDYENVWAISYNNPAKFANSDSRTLFYENLRQTIKSMPQVAALSFTGENLPFSKWTNGTGLNYESKIVMVNNFMVDDSYQNLLNMKILEGRWFNTYDVVAKNRPVVINASLKETLFGTGNAVGKLIGNQEDTEKMKIIGVVDDIKDKGDYKAPKAGIFNRLDTGSYHYLNRILIKVTPNADADFESHLYKTMANAMKNANIEIEHLTDMHTSINKGTVIPMIILLIIAGFLIINVALGLFGVLWYNINKRRGEIGLRRAVGASGNSISKQLVGEALVLSTFSLIIGCVFAVQFPLLNVFNLPSSVYIIALLLAIAFIYILVTICALYPGKQAAAIYPAVALHEE